MESFYKKHKEKASFYVVYIREAHPSDGWRPIPNAPKDPKSIDEREIVASQCIKEMKLTIPFVVDDMKDTANKSYSAWPDRIFIVGTDGKIAYRAGRGPFGFKPKEAQEAFEDLISEKDK